MLKPAGIITALVTPFDEQGKVDQGKLRSLLDLQMETGITGVFLCGTTGETYALSGQERQLILETAVEHVNKRLAIYFGVGANNTHEAVALAKMGKSIGADAITAITPYFVRPSATELEAHFRAIAEATDLPLVLYNHPLRTQIVIPVGVVQRLTRLPNVVGIKDSSGSLHSNINYLLGNDNFAVLSGNDGLILSLLQWGGAGAVSATANFAPKLLCDLYNSFIDGDLKTAQELQRKVFLLRQAFDLGTYPAMIKEALALVGLDVGFCRLPVARLGAAERKELKELLDRVGVETFR